MKNRILSQEELEKSEEGDVIWVEYRNKIVYPMVKCRGIYGCYYGFLYPSELNCSKNMRPWMYKPNEEDMNKKWEE